MNTTAKLDPKLEVTRLAETAFHQRLISGYGNSEYPDEYQIVYKGKPRHLALDHARTFLEGLLNHQDQVSLGV